MNVRTLVTLAVLWLGTGMAPSLRAAEPAREVHGMADAFAVPGLTLAWGVLRGVDEAATTVVVRVAADPSVFPALAATGTDPFTQRTIPLLAATPTAGRVDLAVPRPHFAEFPRTDFFLYASAPATPSDAPKLVVYYLGVPDTTPEFNSRAALDAYLTDRIARARGATGSKAP